jgi:hypothetical protein
MSKNFDQYSLDTDDQLPNVIRLRLRADNLAFVDNQMTKANKHLGAAEMDESFASDLNLNQNANARAYNRHYEGAEYNFLKACGRCAVEGCVLRNDFTKWEDKYHRAPNRHRQIAKAKKQADVGVETPC